MSSDPTLSEIIALSIDAHSLAQLRAREVRSECRREAVRLENENASLRKQVIKLRREIKALAGSGPSKKYVVPPSLVEDYRTLRKSGMKVDEIAKVLHLERKQ